MSDWQDNRNERVIPQGAPIPNTGRPVWELVVEDMKERDKFGREKYGTPLQTFNGRNALVDAYQEVLDLAVYLRQRIEEEKARSVQIVGGCCASSSDPLEGL